MWVKDVRNYDVEIYEEDKLVYSGNVNDAPDDIKDRETKTMTLEHKKIFIHI